MLPVKVFQLKINHDLENHCGYTIHLVLAMSSFVNSILIPAMAKVLDLSP